MKRLYNITIRGRSKRWDVRVFLFPKMAGDMQADGAEVDTVEYAHIPEHPGPLRRLIYWLEETFPAWRYRL